MGGYGNVLQAIDNYPESQEGRYNVILLPQWNTECFLGLFIFQSFNPFPNAWTKEMMEHGVPWLQGLTR